MCQPSSTRTVCAQLEQDAARVLGSAVDEREDSRAFGASVQRTLEVEWPSQARNRGWSDPGLGGRKSVFDLVATIDGHRIGIDVTTTDVDAGRFADGGLASVDAALRVLAGADPIAALVMLEVEHERSDGRRAIRAVTALPLHAIPIEAIRIENLGTGQLRLDEPLRALRARANWDRTASTFVAALTELARAHYRRVVDDALARERHLASFAASGHLGFKSWRRPRSSV